MMTPMHNDLIKHSIPAAPTAHEREAQHALRCARAAVFQTFVRHMFARVPRPAAAPTRPRSSKPS